MSNKTPSIISAVLTIILLIITALVILFAQLLALNGFSERETVGSGYPNGHT